MKTSPRSAPQPDKPSDQYDPPWKAVIEAQLAQFVAFFLPRAYAAIDWSRKPVSLNTELRRWSRESKSPDRKADALFKVWLKSGEEQFVLVHVEVQIHHDGSFAERMFEYGCRAWNHYRSRLAAIALLGDRSPDYRPDRFGWELWDTELSYRFPVVKLLDYRGRREELAASSNVFALVVEAYLATRETRGDPERRRAAKWKLVRLLYERRYSREEIVALFRLIDWMLYLPREQAIIFDADLESLETELDMQYLSSIERRALKKGFEQGVEQGIERGSQRLLRALLERRFGPLPESALDRISTATASLLDAWALRVLDARQLDDVFC